MSKWIDVAKDEELEEGGRVCARADGTGVIVFRIEGELHAVEDMCPHAGMPLSDGDLCGKVLTCVYHGYAYNVDNGKNIDFPEDVPMTLFPVKNEDGQIKVDVDPE